MPFDTKRIHLTSEASAPRSILTAQKWHSHDAALSRAPESNYAGTMVSGVNRNKPKQAKHELHEKIGATSIRQANGIGLVIIICKDDSWEDLNVYCHTDRATKSIGKD